MRRSPRDGELELGPLPAGHACEAWAVSALPASPPLLAPCDFSRQFLYLLGVKSCESAKKLVKNRL